MTAADPLTWTFVLVVAAGAGLVLIAVRGTLALVWRSAALALAAVLMAGGYAALGELMSRPKPVALEWARANAASAKVAASHLRENEAIYLWLIFDGDAGGSAEPRAYRLPWDMRMAQQIRRAQQEAARSRSDVRMKLPFKARREADEMDKVFYAPPRPPLPPKTPDAS